MSKKNSKEIDKNFDVRLSLTFCDGSSKTLKKTLYKKIVSKSFYKKIDTNPKSIFLDYANHVFGRFSVRGVQKHHNKYRKNKSDPGPFLASDLPTYLPTGPRFALAAP
jgi:hypothetical protein